MSQVAATVGMSVSEIHNGSEAYETLATAAKNAGATTKFTATQAAEALNYLALAGYDAGTSAEVLPSVLNLAAAGGLDLAYASDLTTDAMAALGIEASADNLTQFGDQMARASSKANYSVAQLGEAILTVGGTAKNLAGGTVELNTALGVLANRGIKGAEGGTALRNMILSLSAPDR
ncbi:MAG: phage tail tape measure protein [Anaerotignum faecicola]